MTEHEGFRNDPELAEASAGCPVKLCPNKFHALMLCAEYVRMEAIRHGHGGAAELTELLDRLGVSPDFKPDIA